MGAKADRIVALELVVQGLRRDKAVLQAEVERLRRVLAEREDQPPSLLLGIADRCRDLGEQAWDATVGRLAPWV